MNGAPEPGDPPEVKGQSLRSAGRVRLGGGGSGMEQL